MDFIKYNGTRYLQAVSGHLALACPDCGAGMPVALTDYFGEASRVERHCSRCKQVMFPVTEDHQSQWADAHEVWNTNGFGQQVGQLRQFGVAVGRLKEEPFLALHQALADLDPVLAYACQWITKGDLEFALNDAETHKRVGLSVTLESAEEARALALKRIAAAKQSAALITADTTRTVATLIREDALAIVAMYAMVVQLETLCRATSDPGAVREVRNLASRCDIMRRLVSGKMELPANHTRLDFASDEAATIARGVMDKVEAAAVSIANTKAKSL